MKTQTLGERLALSRDSQVTGSWGAGAAGSHLSSREAARARTAVAWLFASVAKRLGRLIRLRAANVEVVLAAHSDTARRAETALRNLEASSAPVHWTLAIDSPAHPFHAEWVHFKQWARDQDLFVEARTELDPVFSRTLHIVRACPLS